MLYTRNAYYFRKYFKEEVAREKNWLDLNFVGSLHPDKTQNATGFAKLIYGNREDLGKLLGTIALNVAADDQAIYELIQNADDSKSTFFSVSYNEKYLLCINNGNYFSDNDMAAIINVAGNFKEGEDIGTFGIGFKILHRLVGKDDGREAIINDYAGPIIFSWNKYFQLEKFLNGEEIKIGGYEPEKKHYSYEKDQENAWLIKILYTCFPTYFEEKVRLKDYETIESRFERNELDEMREFLHESLQNVNLQETNYLKNGSIFFLKLGQGKSKFLDDGIEKIKSGLAYSFKFLNSLKKIYINGDEILEQKVEFYSKSYSVDSEEFLKVNPKNKKRDIKFTFAYYRDYRKAENLRNGLVPNLYTFFSMEEEKNGLNFLLHCNAFDMNNDRRKLQANSQINENLLPTISKDITIYIERQKNKNRELFLTLYANLLLSNEPKNKPHINNYFFRLLKDFVKQNIPTQNSFSDNAENVKIKAIYLALQPSDFGCPEKEWFYWQNEKYDKELIDEARNSEKLNLERWDIIDLVKYAVKKGNIEQINEWVRQAIEKLRSKDSKNDYTYYHFLEEVDKELRERDLPVITEIKLFKFSDENYYSLNEIFWDHSLVLLYDKVAEIKKELRLLGLSVSYINMNRYPNLLKFIQGRLDEEALFKVIAERCKENTLSTEQKHHLFYRIADFNGVGIEKLKDIELFKNSKGRNCPLRNMLPGSLKIPQWLQKFQISRHEYSMELDKYLVKEEDIYKNIILKNWDDIVKQDIDVKSFYQQVKGYYELNNENPKLDKLASIYTSGGFKKAEDVFFNQAMDLRNYDDLNDAIYKIAEIQTPSKMIFNYLTDDGSPFKISRNDGIIKLISGKHQLNRREIFALLEFAKINNEKLFTHAFIEKADEDFLLCGGHHGIYQYFSKKAEIIELLTKYDQFKLLSGDINANNYRELGLWMDKDLHMKVIQTLHFSEDLLPIVRENDREVQLAYLEKLQNFSLVEGKEFDRNSFEHRCLRLAIECYEGNFQEKFTPKIIINGKLRVKDIAVKDDINFEGITLSLANVLPDYKGVSDIISRIISQFTDITRTELAEKVFTISNKKKEEIYTELVTNFPVLENIEQFAFLLHYSKQNKRNYITSKLIERITSDEILIMAYEQNFQELNSYVDIGLRDKIYPSEYAIETEVLPSWVEDWLQEGEKKEKIDFIRTVNVHNESSHVVQIRKSFQVGQMDDIQAKIFSLPQNSNLLINTIKWLQGFTFKESETTKLEAIRHLYARINYSKEIPLLYITSIVDNEKQFNLEVGNLTNYCFETSENAYYQQVLKILQENQFKLLALDYFKQWSDKIPNIKKIQTTTVIDSETIKNNSEEWEDEAYRIWSIDQNYRIEIYKGEQLPYKVMFQEREIDYFYEGTSKEIDGVLFVCQSVLHDIRNQLAKYIKADELIKLYQISNPDLNIVYSLQSRISQLEEVINNLLSGRNATEWKESDTYLDDFNQVITERTFNLITGYKAEAYVFEQLKAQGYREVVWINQASTETDQKIIQAGKTYYILEKGEPFDLTFMDEEGRLCYVQVKATTTTFDRADDVKMIITRKEWLFLQRDENKDRYYITRVFGARDYPSMKFLKMEFKIGT